MKKLVCLVLTAVMVLSLCACGGAGDSAKGLQVGYAREKVMPDTNLTLGGNGTADRESNGALDFLYVTCIALTDGTGETVLLYTQDFLKSNPSYVEPAKTLITQSTGIPEDKIMIASTHTHAAPAIYNSSLPGMDAYRNVYNGAMVRVAQKALEDRSGAEISVGSVIAEGLAFSRHYILPDGTIMKNAPASENPVGHPDDPDQEAQIIKFTRAAEDKQDIILMNYTVHPTFNNGKMMSADVPGPTRDYIAEETGALVAYFTAAAGNQGGDSKIPTEAHKMDYQEYGAALGKYIVDALPTLTPIEDGNIILKKLTYSGDAYKAKVEMAVQAKEVVTAYNQGGQASANPLVTKYGLDSVWEAIAIVERAQEGTTIEMDLFAIAIGELSFIFAPYEMFAPTGIDIKDRTPYDMTFVVTCANGDNGYLPTEKAFDYKVYEDLVTHFVPGTAEDLADTYIEMLTELKNGAA